tara:strand:+ start:43 stop:204 length:162 start_codon:yes stop_codon:yes gene_type:complete
LDDQVKHPEFLIEYLAGIKKGDFYEELQAILTIPAGLFIGFTTIVVNRLHQCM